MEGIVNASRIGQAIQYYSTTVAYALTLDPPPVRFEILTLGLT